MGIPNKGFFGKKVNMIFMYFLDHFIEQNLKNILEANIEL